MAADYQSDLWVVGQSVEDGINLRARYAKHDSNPSIVDAFDYNKTEVSHHYYRCHPSDLVALSLTNYVRYIVFTHRAGLAVTMSWVKLGGRSG